MESNHIDKEAEAGFAKHEANVISTTPVAQGSKSTGLADPPVSDIVAEDIKSGMAAKLLLPRPTDDPKDPLTWSPWRKHLAMFTVLLFVFLSNWITATITPIFVSIIKEFRSSAQHVSWLITFNILFLGIGNLFWIPLSLKIGKRPVLLVSSAIFFASSIWAAVAQSWGSMLGARIVQGFGASSSEAIGPAIIADLYFIHERGAKVGIYSFAIASGAALGTIFAGLVAHANSDWRMVFWMNVALTGFCFLCTFLFQAETNFNRPTETETEAGAGFEASQLEDIRRRANPSWVRSLTITGWYDGETSIWWLWMRPFLTLQYPAVVWGSLVYGVTLAWVVLQQTVNATAFPQIYHFNELAVGNINIACLIGAIVGCLAGGPLTDYVSAAISKRRGEYFKPEFRLWCFIPPALLGAPGLLMWGFGLEEKLPSLVSIAGCGITYGVLCAVPAVAMTYVVDCYRPLAGETMTVLTAFKNAFAFALSFGVVPWVEHDGFARVSGWMTLIEGVLFLTTIPMYLYGARLREWTTKFVV